MIVVAGPSIPLRVIESDPVGQRVACKRPCRIGPDFRAIAVGDRAFQLKARIEAGLLGGNDQRTDGRVFAKQRSLRPAHQLDMIEIDEVQPAEAHMGEEDIVDDEPDARRSEEHTSELQSLIRISYAVFCLKKKIKIIKQLN